MPGVSRIDWAKPMPENPYKSPAAARKEVPHVTQRKRHSVVEWIGIAAALTLTAAAAARQFLNLEPAAYQHAGVILEISGITLSVAWIITLLRTKLAG